jgi:hypothetical protein
LKKKSAILNTVLLLTAISPLLLCCKPTEANYSAVYEANRLRKDSLLRSVDTLAGTPLPGANQSAVSEDKLIYEKLQCLVPSDSVLLTRFSIVVATLSVAPAAQLLQQRLAEDGIAATVTFTAKPQYRVIIPAGNSRPEAVARRSEIREFYRSQYSVEQLKARYNQTFDFLPILYKTS